MNNLFNKSIVSETSLVTTVTSTEVFMDQAELGSIQSVYTDTTPDDQAFASTDVDTTEDTITTVDHGFVTGLKVQLTTTGALPTGVSASTDYFIIVVDADTYKFATSYANAIAGTDIDLTAAGSGDSSTNPVALSGSLQLQISNAGITWTAEGSATSISATGSVVYKAIPGTGANRARLVYTHTAGMLSLESTANMKG